VGKGLSYFEQVSNSFCKETRNPLPSIPPFLVHTWYYTSLLVHCTQWAQL